MWMIRDLSALDSWCAAFGIGQLWPTVMGGSALVTTPALVSQYDSYGFETPNHSRFACVSKFLRAGHFVSHCLEAIISEAMRIL